MGHQASHQTVAQLLHNLGHSLQGNRKTLEGSSHPDRDAQFEHINSQAQEYLATSDPVISVDTKKKELVGEFKNGGREWHPQGMAPRVKVHDFVDPELGRAVPYGVYDVAGNNGWVSVGVDHDTSSFAVETIRRWWYSMGSERYPEAKRLLITADGGGSNGSRVRLWKLELQALADELGLSIAVSHFPPGNEQMEQDRAPSLLFHQSELARQAPDQSRGHCGSHCIDHHPERPAGTGTTRYQKISSGKKGQRARNCAARSPSR
jgi:hypothetical protein